MPMYMKNEENEEDIGSILDITEVLAKNPDTSEGNEAVEENKVEVEVDDLLDKKKEVEEKETEVINENLNISKVLDVRKCEENYESKDLDDELSKMLLRN